MLQKSVKTWFCAEFCLQRYSSTIEPWKSCLNIQNTTFETRTVCLINLKVINNNSCSATQLGKYFVTVQTIYVLSVFACYYEYTAKYSVVSIS